MKRHLLLSMASYDDDCYDMNLETWVRHHVATSNTLILDGSLERRIKEFTESIQQKAIRVFVDLAGSDTPEQHAEGHLLSPDEVVTPRTAAKEAFNAAAERYTVVTDFYERRIGENGYVMSGTGVMVPDSLYDHF